MLGADHTFVLIRNRTLRLVPLPLASGIGIAGYATAHTGPWERRGGLALPDWLMDTASYLVGAVAVAYALRLLCLALAASDATPVVRLSDGWLRRPLLPRRFDIPRTALQRALVARTPADVPRAKLHSGYGPLAAQFFDRLVFRYHTALGLGPVVYLDLGQRYVRIPQIYVGEPTGLAKAVATWAGIDADQDPATNRVAAILDTFWTPTVSPQPTHAVDLDRHARQLLHLLDQGAGERQLKRYVTGAAAAVAPDRTDRSGAIVDAIVRWHKTGT